MTAKLSQGYKALALKLQEAALLQSDVAKRLSDAVNDYHRASGSYGYYIDHDGDGSEGNCIYCCDGDIRSAPYELGSTAGKVSQSIDFDNSSNVVPVASYVPEADDSDHYTAMGESFQADKLYTGLPVYERFISKKTRDAADNSSFAGKGRSFPILKPTDVSAALHSIGRAGSDNYSGDTIRTNIKRIAKAKGFPLPDSLKNADDKESASSWKPEGALLKEAAKFIGDQPLVESMTTSYPIKLISPGRGSSGYYTPEVLKKAGEANVFKAGTQMFWNHDTDAEEGQRPEGDLSRLAAVTTTDAKYDEAGRDGPGLYANAKVFADYASQVKEKGPHIGLSIRAGGARDDAKEGPDGRRGVITALNNAHSVDFVTRAGRDGKIFTESKRETDDMTKEEIQAMISESQKPLVEENKKLLERLAMQDAPRVIREAMADIRLPDASKSKIVREIAESADSATLADAAKLKALIETRATAELAFLKDLGLPNVAGVGVRMTEKELKQEATQHEDNYKEATKAMADYFVGLKLSKDADPALREARRQARKKFMEGRAAA